MRLETPEQQETLEQQVQLVIMEILGILVRQVQQEIREILVPPVILETQAQLVRLVQQATLVQQAILGLQDTMMINQKVQTTDLV